MIIKILGGGCQNCKRLEANVKKACELLGMDASVEKVQDYADIAAYGVMSTPALVIGEEVKVYGRVPEVDEIKKLLKAV
jgi:small redox-active disulfide protein 2